MVCAIHSGLSLYYAGSVLELVSCFSSLDLVFTQGKLEDAVEILSQLVSRPYLKTPQIKMGEAARNVDYVCEEYLKAMKEVAKEATTVEQKPEQRHVRKQDLTLKLTHAFSHGAGSG